MRRRVKRRHGSRGWPARGTAHEDGRRRRATRAAAREGKQREEEEEADGWGPGAIFFFFSLFFFLGRDNPLTVFVGDGGENMRPCWA